MRPARAPRSGPDEAKRDADGRTKSVHRKSPTVSPRPYHKSLEAQVRNALLYQRHSITGAWHSLPLPDARVRRSRRSSSRPSARSRQQGVRSRKPRSRAWSRSDSASRSFRSRRRGRGRRAASWRCREGRWRRGRGRSVQSGYYDSCLRIVPPFHSRYGPWEQ